MFTPGSTPRAAITASCAMDRPAAGAGAAAPAAEGAAAPPIASGTTFFFFLAGGLSPSPAAPPPPSAPSCCFRFFFSPPGAAAAAAPPSAAAAPAGASAAGAAPAWLGAAAAPSSSALRLPLFLPPARSSNPGSISSVRSISPCKPTRGSAALPHHSVTAVAEAWRRDSTAAAGACSAVHTQAGAAQQSTPSHQLARPPARQPATSTRCEQQAGHLLQHTVQAQHTV